MSLNFSGNATLQKGISLWISKNLEEVQWPTGLGNELEVRMFVYVGKTQMNREFLVLQGTRQE